MRKLSLRRSSGRRGSDAVFIPPPAPAERREKTSVTITQSELLTKTEKREVEVEGKDKTVKRLFTEEYRLFGYVLHFKCGHDREMPPKFDDIDDARDHAKWAVRNTLCQECSLDSRRIKAVLENKLREERDEEEEP